MIRSSLAMRMQPASSHEADTLYEDACRLWTAARRRDAIERLDAALRLDPDAPHVLVMGGYMLGEMGKAEAAVRFYRRALLLDPRFTVAHANLGKLLVELRRPAEALEAFGAVFALKPADADAWNGRAGALRELGRLEDSLVAARRALALKPDFPEAAINCGNALLKLDRMEEALLAYRQASAARPGYAAALCGEALALRNLGRYGEALAAFEAAESLGAYEAVAGKGCLLLTLGDFERGFEGYEARWLEGKSLAEALGARYPTWKGPGRGQNRVLVLNDHGFGDTIQFVRYLPLMKSAGVEVTFVCPAKLRRLLAPALAARLVEAAPDEPFDAQIAISSLPRAFRTRLDTVPAAVPYTLGGAGARDPMGRTDRRGRLQARDRMAGQSASGRTVGRVRSRLRPRRRSGAFQAFASSRCRRVSVRSNWPGCREGCGSRRPARTSIPARTP